MSSIKIASRTLPIMILIIMVGFFLRVYRLTAVPLRGDEAFSVQYWAGQPLQDSLAKTATIEPHPLLTYATFRAWGLLAGTSELAMRILPVFVGLLGIPALYAVGKKLSGKAFGLLAAFLFAIHPFEIWHAQDARNYAIWAGISLIALWLGLRALDENRPKAWILYTFVASIAANIFYTELLSTAALGVYVIVTYWGDWKRVRRWIASAAIAGGLSIASFVIFQLPLFSRGGYTGSIGGGLDVTLLWTHFLPVLYFGEITLPTSTLSNMWPIMLVGIVIGLALLWRVQTRTALFLTSLALIPPLMLTVLSLKLNIFTARYVLAIVPALILIGAALLQLLSSKHTIGKIAAMVILIGWLLMNGQSLANYYFDPTYAKAPHWPELTRYVQEHSQTSDIVIQSAVDSAFGYYYHQGHQDVAPDIALPETPTQPAAEIEAKLARLSQDHTAIWQVGQEFPDWSNAGVVRRWLDKNMQLVLSGKPGGLPMLQYKNWEVDSTEVDDQYLANFSDIAQLKTYKLIMPADKNGTLTLWLYWQPIGTSAAQLKVFVHLIGATNPATGSPLWTQDDRFPQNGRVSTQNWQPTMLYRDVYILDLNGIPSAAYSLEVGMYDPLTNTRLAVGDADSLILQQIDLK